MRRALLLLATLTACGTSEPSRPDGVPQPPGKQDGGAFTVSGARAWYLIGDALTPGDPALDLTITGPADAEVVDLWLDGHHVRRAHRGDGGADGWLLRVPLDDVAAGAHRVLLAADGAHVAFAAVDFQRSRPLYVAVSNDWDTGDHGDDKLTRQERLHANHPHMVMTHFVGPYTFTDPSVSAARADALVAWLHDAEATYGDEVGLHIHPYCNFVTTAGVTCRTQPSFAKASDATGYTVILASYTQPELEAMFAKAGDLFEAHGLARPTSFRAGGWTADLHVLAALGAAGLRVDSSAVNWARLEEWKDVAGAQLYPWNRAQWAPIDETSQPYYPATDDVLADAAPHLPVLEVPDNGALVDYVTGAEMIDMFRANFDGQALAAPRTYSIGYHPVDFSEDFFARLDTALTEIDRHLAVDDAGPVVYARETDLATAYARP